MSGMTVIFGNGTIGSLVTQRLVERGDKVRIAQRSRPAELAGGAEAAGPEYISCDILDPQAVRRAVEGASNVLLAVGFVYDSRVWASNWTTTMRNIIAACAEVGARVVFIDNLYQLGPKTQPRTEDMALTPEGEKSWILAEVTQIWMDARDRVPFAALRCTDFYGPHVTASHLGTSAFGGVANGKAAFMLAPLDTPHDFAYAPDIARAAITLLDAPNDAFGQIWNMPCAPTRTPREILQLGAKAIDQPLKVISTPLWLLPFMGFFIRFAKEVSDVKFTWNRPYQVNADKFKRRFWSDVTSFEVGAAATARSFLPTVAEVSHEEYTRSRGFKI